MAGGRMPEKEATRREIERLENNLEEMRKGASYGTKQLDEQAIMTMEYKLAALKKRTD